MVKELEISPSNGSLTIAKVMFIHLTVKLNADHTSFR